MNMPRNGSGSDQDKGAVWVAVQIVLLLLILFSAGQPALPGAGGRIEVIMGLLIGAAGLGIVVLSTTNLGSNLSIFPRPRDDASLIQTGLYGIVRHPIYLGVILSALGWSLLRGSLIALVITIGLFFFFDRKAHREEVWLMEKFPDYASYRGRVHKLIPWLY
ncbi:MAG TPA: isoprenylcysteine carboxylmethyltransferase family protein [Aggregatilineales bacterium]|nr:isoprenylcysteine carboxylmethyltransferase family protein [Aggregatilineales bacterium]